MTSVGPAILVLGATGMLGSACVRRLRRREPHWRIDGSARVAGAAATFDVAQGEEALGQILDGGPYRCMINCIGVARSDVDELSPSSVARAVRVNALFPHLLASVAAPRGARVISVSSDAVFSGQAVTPRLEGAALDPVDVYGRSKALGESSAPHVLNIRCSVVGRDPRGRGLTEWYLRTPAAATVTGFSDYIWTPATVYQIADFIHAILRNNAFAALREAGAVVHFAPNAALSKFDYLTLLNRMSGLGARVESGPAPGGPRRRVLATSSALVRELWSGGGWTEALQEFLSEESPLEVT